MRYVRHDVVFKEVPSEVAFVMSISGCPNGCKGCHSAFLQSDIGTELTIEEFDAVFSIYEKHTTAICFLGGDQYPNLLELIKHIKSKYPHKIVVYTGRDEIDNEYLQYLSYVKIGRYDDECGPLNKRTTNQKYYQVENGELVDKTYLFWKE